MPCRNRGEILRLMLAEARCPYEFEVVGFEKWSEYAKAAHLMGSCLCCMISPANLVPLWDKRAQSRGFWPTGLNSLGGHQKSVQPLTPYTASGLPLCATTG